MYSPIQGTFVSQDPIGIESGDLNPYRYALNDPVNGTDPSGLTVQFTSEKEANAFAAELRKLGAKTVSVNMDSVDLNEPPTPDDPSDDSICFHVYASMQDIAAVFEYADTHFSGVFVPRREFPRGGPVGEIAERRRKFLEALILKPTSMSASTNKDGEDSPCDGYDEKFIFAVRKKLEQLNRRVIVKLDHGGEGHDNTDRLNFNVCGIETRFHKSRIRWLIPKTKFDQPSPFAAESVDQVFVENLPVGLKIYRSIVLDSARILKVGGELVLEGPNNPLGGSYRSEGERALQEAGYSIKVSDESFRIESVPMFRARIIIRAKPKK